MKGQEHSEGLLAALKDPEVESQFWDWMLNHRGQEKPVIEPISVTEAVGRFGQSNGAGMRIGPRTFTDYATDLVSFSRWVTHHLGDETLLSQITVAHLVSFRKFRARLEREFTQEERAEAKFCPAESRDLPHTKKARSVSLHNRVIQALRKFFSYAIEHKWAIENLARHGDLKLVEPNLDFIMRSLSEDELGRLDKYVATTRYPIRNQFIVHLFLNTGLRLNEAACLQWKDVYLDAGYIHVTKDSAKGGWEHKVALSDESIAAIRTWLQWYEAFLGVPPQPTHPVLPKVENLRVQGPGRLSRRGLQSMITGWLRKAGIRKGGPHRFRHTYGCHLVKQDVHLRAIQDQLGHKDPRKTQLYTKLSIEERRRILNEKLNLPGNRRSLKAPNVSSLPQGPRRNREEHRP